MKNWCFWTVVLEKTFESPLESKEIQPVHPKGKQSWIFIGRTDAEAETPIPWPPDVKSWLIWKDSDAGKDWRQENRGQQRMRWLDGITDWMDVTFKFIPGVCDMQGVLSCCSPWVCKELDRTERLNWTGSYGPREHRALPHPYPAYLLSNHTFFFILTIPG